VLQAASATISANGRILRMMFLDIASRQGNSSDLSRSYHPARTPQFVCHMATQRRPVHP
jgi:hypothetical protein